MKREPVCNGELFTVGIFFRGSEKKYTFVLTDLLSLLLFQRYYVFIRSAFSYSFIYLFILYSMTN